MSFKHILFVNTAQEDELEADAYNVQHIAGLANETDAWNRQGHGGAKPRASVLSGWYRIMRLLINLILSDPRDALFLRKFTPETDMFDALDLFFQFEPRMFLLVLVGMSYTILGLGLTYGYIHLRRRKRCGGDRTQDLSENMRCILQLYTAGYIVVLALIILASVLMLGSLYEMGRAFRHGGESYKRYLDDVAQYIGNASQSIEHNCVTRKTTLVELHNTMLKEFENDLYDYAIKVVQFETKDVHRMAYQLHAQVERDDTIIAEEQPNEAYMIRQTLPSTIPEVQDYIAKHIATQIYVSYNSTFTEAARLARESILELESFIKDLKQDAQKTIKGVRLITNKILEADRWNVIGALRDKSIYYIGATLFSFGILLSLYTGGFIIGMYNYNESLPPTKRTNASNYAGFAMLTAVVISFPICSILMLATMAAMVLALTLAAYICRPYVRVVFKGAPLKFLSLLDDTHAYLWPQESRGKYFGQLLVGTVINKCKSGRLFDVIIGDFQTALIGFINQTENINDLLVSLAVDPNLIFGVTPPLGKPAQFYDEMQSRLWDDLDDITEGFVRKRIGWLVQSDQTLFHINPYCYAAYEGYLGAFGILCSGVIRNLNSFWLSLSFCLWLFLALAVLSHNLSKYFLRMVNYTLDGSEVSESESSSSTTQQAEPKEGEAPVKTGSADEAAAAPTPTEEPQDKLPKWLHKGRRKSQATLGSASSRLSRMTMNQQGSQLSLV